MRRLGRFAEGLLEAGWLTVVILVPLFIDKGASEVFEPAKAGILRAIALVMLAAWGVVALTRPPRDASARADGASALSRLARAPLVLSAAAVVAATSLANALSIAQSESFWGHLPRAQGTCTLLAYTAIFAATACNLSSEAQLRRLVGALILPSLPIATYAVAQRFGLEPLQVTVRETESQRVTSLLGQPVFLAAYLAMVMPFTLLCLRDALRMREHAVRRIGGAVFHAALALLQLTAALLTESRGPLLALLTALALVFLAHAARRGLRRTVVIGAVVAGIGVVVVRAGAPANVVEKASTLAGERTARRAAETFAVTGGGGQFRLTSWKIAERVMRNRTPLERADGTRDPHPGIRPLVGYGPETQYAVSPTSYDAELPTLFGYFLLDRFHNDLWDALITTGVLGALAWIILQSALFSMVFRGLGLVPSSRRKTLFWVAYLGGAAASAAGWTLARGVPFFWLGLQLGAVAGLALFLAGIAVWPRAADERRETPTAHDFDEGVLIAILAACAGHLIEASFSFTVVATGASFWLFGAVALVCVRRTTGGASDRDATVGDPALMGGALLGLAMIALGAAFLGGPSTPRRPGDVLWDGLTLLSQPDGQRRPVVLLIALSTLLLGAILLADDRPAAIGRAFARRVGVMFGVGFGVAFIVWMRLAFILARRGASIRDVSAIVSTQLDIRHGLMTSLYLSCLLVMALFAWARGRRTEPLSGAAPVPIPRAALAFALTVGAVVAIVRVSLHPSFAEAAISIGATMMSQRKPLLAEESYGHAIALRPLDIYRSTLAKAYAWHARAEPARAAAWLEKADREIRAAIDANPIASEHATNLAVIRAQWAQSSTDAQRIELTGTVHMLFARAIRLNPEDPGLYRLWANVQNTLMHDPDAALASAQMAVPRAPNDPETHGLLAECHMALARTQQGEPRRAHFRAAAKAFQDALSFAPNEVRYRVGEGKAYLEAGEPGKAVRALQAALATTPATSPVHKSATAALRRAELALASVTAPPSTP